MNRKGICFKVKSEKIAEYKERHDAVWEELLEALRRHGWRNYSLFMRGDGLVFGYFEPVESYEASVAGVEAEEIDKKWKEWNKSHFEPTRFETLDSWIEGHVIELEEVFHLD